MSKKVLSVTVVLAGLSLLSQPVYATGNASVSTEPVVGTWSNVDPNAGIQKTNKIEHKAWEVDQYGNKKEVTPLEKLPKSGDATVEDFTDSSGYYYVWDRYDPWYSDSDEFHFFVGSITYRNTSPSYQKMTYTQLQSHTSSWVTTGKVSAETQFGNALIANAKYNVGFELQRNTTTMVGTNFAADANVTPYKTGQLSAYDAGGYSGGAGVWKKYSPSRTSLLGTYNETGDGWAVAANRKAFSYNEW